MEPILTLPFYEITVINELERLFSKKEGYAITIPSSRQQKGFDIILYNAFTRMSKTIQIKGSRTYTPTPPKRETTIRYKNYTWFNSFKAEEGLSDYYILFGLYLNSSIQDPESTRLNYSNWFDYVLLLFTEKEMQLFINSLTLKTSEKKDRMFGFGFDDTKNIYLTRGLKVKSDFSDKLLKKRAQEIKSILNPGNRRYITNKKKPSN